MKFGPGEHIESRCTRCHDVTGHIIIALVDDEIVKVVCQACGSIHKYYPPKKKHITKNINISKVFKEKNKNSIRHSNNLGIKKQRMLEEAFEKWQQVMNTYCGTPKIYNMDASFALGDIIDHPTFGRGVVQELRYPDKVQILFREGVKVLKCLLR